MKLQNKGDKENENCERINEYLNNFVTIQVFRLKVMSYLDSLRL